MVNFSEKGEWPSLNSTCLNSLYFINDFQAMPFKSCWSRGAQLHRLCSGPNLCGWEEQAFALCKAWRMSPDQHLLSNASRETPFSLQTSPSPPAQTMRKEKRLLGQALDRGRATTGGWEGWGRESMFVSSNAVNLNFKT